MEQVLRVGDISIKATMVRNRKGRKGYFIDASELANNARVVIVDKSAPKKTSRTKRSSTIRPDVQELLDEMKEYKEGRINLRSFDEFIKTV